MHLKEIRFVAIDRDLWLERVRSVWNERSASWDEMSEANAVAPDRAADLERIVSALGIAPGERILDAGCGTGQYAIAFARLGFIVTAVDLAPDMIARANLHAESLGVPVTFRIEDVGALSDLLAVYSAIHARVVLQFVPNIPDALNELRRVMKPGGRMLASVPGALSPIYSHSWRRHVDPENAGMNFVTPWELEEILTSLGWTVLDQWGEFGDSVPGTSNFITALDIARLPIRLQQAAATTWTFVVR
jgi:2-polyprenyl-3-methyl-5-hydroxy-6-metoxy-1,4-benzoquinol methylase